MQLSDKLYVPYASPRFAVSGHGLATAPVSLFPDPVFERFFALPVFVQVPFGLSTSVYISRRVVARISSFQSIKGAKTSFNALRKNDVAYL